jgi:hypothetical protein
MATTTLELELRKEYKITAWSKDEWNALGAAMECRPDSSEFKRINVFHYAGQEEKGKNRLYVFVKKQGDYIAIMTAVDFLSDGELISPLIAEEEGIEDYVNVFNIKRDLKKMGKQSRTLFDKIVERGGI